MRALSLLSAVTVALALAGCGSNCTLKGCPAVLTLHVVDSSGQPVTRFSGTLDLDGRSTDFACKADNLGSGTHYSCDGPGLVTFPGFAEAGGHYDLTVTDDQTLATSHGPPAATFQTQHDFNGQGCGDCSTGEATVHLPAP